MSLSSISVVKRGHLLLPIFRAPHKYTKIKKKTKKMRKRKYKKKLKKIKKIYQ
jgi:hypothetical protein